MATARSRMWDVSMHPACRTFEPIDLSSRRGNVVEISGVVLGSCGNFLQMFFALYFENRSMKGKVWKGEKE